jgi:hypothetical protein
MDCCDEIPNTIREDTQNVNTDCSTACSVQWPTNAQLTDKLLYCCYMFWHCCGIRTEFAVSTLLSYLSMSNAAVGNTVWNFTCVLCCWISMFKILKYENCPIYNKMANIILLLQLPCSQTVWWLYIDVAVPTRYGTILVTIIIKKTAHQFPQRNVFWAH